MRSMNTMLLEFHRSFGATINTVPTVPNVRDRKMRHSLVVEELTETRDALKEKKFDEFVDGLIDTLYVAVGTNVTYGIETIEPRYGMPSHAPAFPSDTGRHVIDGLMKSLIDISKITLDPECHPTPELAIIKLCMNKVIGDCLHTLYICGVDAMPVFAEVHLANMRKLGPDGLPIKREDGKVLKPEGWTPPDIQRVLDEQTRRFDYPTPAEG